MRCYQKRIMSPFLKPHGDIVLVDDDSGCGIDKIPEDEWN
jgi:hypothetical protein